MKNFLLGFFAFALILPSILGFCACKAMPKQAQTPNTQKDQQQEPEQQTATFTKNNNFAENAKQTALWLNTNVYNKRSPSSGSSEYISLEDAGISSENYYTEVGTLSENFGEVTSISFGNISFAKDATTDISVGNSVFLRDKVYYVQNNKLFVAGPILAIESANNENIKINGTEYALGATAQTPLAVGAVGFSGNTNTVTRNENTFNLHITNPKEFVVFGLEGQQVATNVALTRKFYTNPDGSTSITYGLTKADDSTGGLYGVGLYVLGYFSTAEQVAAANGTELTYTMFVINNSGEYVGTTSNLKLVVSTVETENA